MHGVKQISASGILPCPNQTVRESVSDLVGIVGPFVENRLNCRVDLIENRRPGVWREEVLNHVDPEASFAVGAGAQTALEQEEIEENLLRSFCTAFRRRMLDRGADERACVVDEIQAHVIDREQRLAVFG
jgi:hypothetical protein